MYSPPCLKIVLCRLRQPETVEFSSVRLAPEEHVGVKPAVGLAVEVFTEGEKDAPPCYWSASITEVRGDVRAQQPLRCFPSHRRDRLSRCTMRAGTSSTTSTSASTASEHAIRSMCGHTCVHALMPFDCSQPIASENIFKAVITINPDLIP